MHILPHRKILFEAARRKQVLKDITIEDGTTLTIYSTDYPWTKALRFCRCYNTLTLQVAINPATNLVANQLHSTPALDFLYRDYLGPQTFSSSGLYCTRFMSQRITATMLDRQGRVFPYTLRALRTYMKIHSQH